MINKENHLGKIGVSDAYLKELVCRTVSRCFGVAGMKCCSFKEFILCDIFGKKSNGIGTFIMEKDNELIVNLHITVTYGTNISAVMNSIKNKVTFALNEYAGVTVRAVNVFVDGIKN